jgi:hypothetical protein
VFVQNRAAEVSNPRPQLLLQRCGLFFEGHDDQHDFLKLFQCDLERKREREYENSSFPHQHRDDIAFFTAFLWEPGLPMIDLNPLITPASDIHVRGVSSINERGEISAVGLLPNGESRALLLVPVSGR